MKKYLLIFIILLIILYFVSFFQQYKNCKTTSENYRATLISGMDYEIEKGYIKVDEQEAEKARIEKYIKQDFKACLHNYYFYTFWK
ncbi:MAG: hypothetical protein WCW17_00715 [Patescibacteria group bacterium]|jgi:hypothetical protein